MERILLWQTLVGSHAWGMNRPDSDRDMFECFIYPTSAILRGEASRESFFTHNEREDTHSHEAGVVATQLLKGNINFLIGVIATPIMETKYLTSLREFIVTNPTRNFYHSIRGMALHNYGKYMADKECDPKRSPKILRVIEFGIRLLTEGKLELKPLTRVSIEEIPEAVKRLDGAYVNSKLPDVIPEEPVRGWLFDLRVANLNGGSFINTSHQPI